METIKLPSSFEAESYIVGCLILYPDYADDVFSQINSTDFYYKDNRAIMEAIEAIYKTNGIIDQVTVLDELKKNGKLEEAGGINNLFVILANIPSSANIDAYTFLINQKSVERRLLNVVDKIHDNIISGNYDHTDLMIQSEKSFSDVMKNQSKEEPQRVDLLTDDIISIIEDNKNKEGNLVGLDTGYPSLNNLTNGFKKGELIILAARPAIGKSTFALNLASNICKKKKNIAFFSLEMGHDQLIMRMLSTFSGVNLDKIISGKLSNDDMSLVMQARNKINKLGLYIDQSSSSNLRDIKVKCQNLYREGKLDMIVIDYLQLLSSGEGTKSRVEEIGIISRGLKEMARRFNVPVLALSQLSRLIERRDDSTPVLSDLRESGSIEQDADIVMFLHREKPKTEADDTAKKVYSAKIQCIIAKNRQGMTDKFDLIFKGNNSVFNSVSDIEEK